MRRGLEMLKKHYQVVLVTCLSKNYLKAVREVLESRGILFDAIYMGKKHMVSYELMYQDFELSNNDESILVKK